MWKPGYQSPDEVTLDMEVVNLLEMPEEDTDDETAGMEHTEAGRGLAEYIKSQLLEKYVFVCIYVKIN